MEQELCENGRERLRSLFCFDIVDYVCLYNNLENEVSEYVFCAVCSRILYGISG